MWAPQATAASVTAPRQGMTAAAQLSAGAARRTMDQRQVRFTFSPGIRRRLFGDAVLWGSWDGAGRYASSWSSRAMVEDVGPDGCQRFTAIVDFDAGQVGWLFRWGVMVNTHGGGGTWAIATEVKDRFSNERVRAFRLGGADPGAGPQEEVYYLVQQHWLGANKRFGSDGGRPDIQFAVWAPNARQVNVVFGRRESGYIADDGTGIDSSVPVLPMRRDDASGIWFTGVTPDFTRYDHRPYMYQVTKRGGNVAYRSDLYSRCQIGSGDFDPQGRPYDGTPRDLDGARSCSVVVDPQRVAKLFQEGTWPEHEFVDDVEFWRDELGARPLPSRIEDLVIYELHVGSLGFPRAGAGNFGDAMAFLDHLVEVGVNAVELMPMNEFDGSLDWGYSTSHYFALEYSAGGRDQFKHFVRACHQRGIAVILDVVYNHYHHRAERAEWAYDADEPENNTYYWYEGRPGDYPSFEYAAAHPNPGDRNPPVPGHGGYVDNMSTGYAPRFHEEMVRKLFISSAVALVEEFHIDGVRVDQTTSIHAYNVLHADGRPVSDANVFGAKFLREYCRTMKMVRPDVFLIAEDHSSWDKVAETVDRGGLGFDATWYADFYHHLVGSQERSARYACLIHRAGFGGDDPLPMDWFAGALRESGNRRVVYHESHDEAGNARFSARTMKEAAHWAPLAGEIRTFAEARARFAVGMAFMSAGTPMFFMGEEVASARDFVYGDFRNNREDLLQLAESSGRPMMRFYRDVIGLRRNMASRQNYVDYVHNSDRVIAFRRWGMTGEFLVVGSLRNRPFDQGYIIPNLRTADGMWREVLNSDAEHYGGRNVGNLGGRIRAAGGAIRLNIPANGFVVLQRE